jgi:hypothetical protein
MTDKNLQFSVNLNVEDILQIIQGVKSLIDSDKKNSEELQIEVSERTKKISEEFRKEVFTGLAGIKKENNAFLQNLLEILNKKDEHGNIVDPD